MMKRPVYLGDEVSAAGYRLAGAAVQCPAQGEAAAALSAALGQASLVLVSAPVAQALDAQQLQAALAGLSPLVLVVPGSDGRTPAPDLAARLRVQLGMEA